MSDTHRVVLTDHIVPGAAHNVTVQTLDGPGSGGAHHVYLLQWAGAPGRINNVEIRFQNGPIAEAGANGVSGEALMSVLIHRLRCFQAGPFACRENALALTNLEQSLMWLQKRTHDRIARNVEGTHAK